MENTVQIENPAATMRDVMEELGKHDVIEKPAALDLMEAHLVALPNARTVKDVNEFQRKALEALKPLRRKGTAEMQDLQSLIDWSNRFKGENSVLYAMPTMENPSMTCIANYHDEGPAQTTPDLGDPSAKYCDHKAVYKFPLSKEWKKWLEISDVPMDKDEMGNFIEERALDVLDPTPALIKGVEATANADWENRLIQIAQKLDGRFGQLKELLAMSRRFQVNETSNLSVKTNRDTGEQQVQFLNEHKDADGKPLSIPNLITIAIPVFLNGAPYRMAVRFRYRKSGSSVKFIMSVHNPEVVFDAAFDEAVKSATDQTDLPVFMGKPES